MHRRDISRALLAVTAGSLGTKATSATKAESSAGQGRTAAEAAARIPVLNDAYPPGCVDRYATNDTPGKTSMVAGFDAAIKQAQAGGAHVTYGASAPYLLDAPVNCTFAGDAAQRGVTIRNVGDTGFEFPSILAKHDGVAVFDCTGTKSVNFYDVVITTDNGIYPQTGIFWARNNKGGSLFHRMIGCRIFGKFSVAPFYNYGAEDDVLIDCYLANYANTPGTKVAVWTANNVAGLKSVVPDIIATGQKSCIDHNCFGNQYYNRGGTDTSDCIYLEQSDSWKNYGGWAYSAASNSNGRALVYVDMSKAPTSFGLISGLTGEVSTHLQAYGVYFSDHAVTPTGWNIDSCRLPNDSNAIFAGPRATLDNFRIRNVSEQKSHGLSVGGTLQHSIVESGTMNMNINKSKNNTLIGRADGWSIGSREHDAWIDQGGTNRAWVAGLMQFQAEGALTQRTLCVAHGPLVTVNVVLSAAGNLSCSRGAQITGLPYGAKDHSSNVSIMNVTSHSPIHGAYVRGNEIVLPELNVGSDRLVISATYFAA